MVLLPCMAEDIDSQLREEGMDPALREPVWALHKKPMSVEVAREIDAFLGENNEKLLPEYRNLLLDKLRNWGKKGESVDTVSPLLRERLKRIAGGQHEEIATVLGWGK